MKIPKIRFPGFTEEWEKQRLSNILEFEYGMNAAGKEFDGENKYIRITDIEESSRKFLQTKLVSPEGKITEKYRVKFGDILFARTGASTGKTYKYTNNDGKIYFAGFLIRGRVDKKTSVDFIFCLTLNYKYKSWINVMSMRSGQPGINAKEYGSYEFRIPKIKEQQKIGDFFMLLDKRIEQQEQKIALLKDYKKAMMKKIFSQKIRFKDENGNDYPDWEEKKLGEIGVFYRGHSYKATDVSSEGLLVLRSNNISNDSITLSTGLQYVTKKCNNEIILENNDIVICMANGSKNLVGKSGIFHKKNEFQTVTAGAFCSIYRAQNSLSRYLFQTDKYKKYLSILFSGTNINNLKNSDLEELKFKLPKRAEEKRIFLLFQKLDINIEKQEGILENLKNQKEVLLQKMFI